MRRAKRTAIQSAISSSDRRSRMSSGVRDLEQIGSPIDVPDLRARLVRIEAHHRLAPLDSLSDAIRFF